MAKSANLGFPRIGAFRELKKAVESYWKGNSTEQDLQNQAKEIRKTNWLTQKNAGVDIIPSNDFSFYDLVLDHTAMFGLIPARYKFTGEKVDLTTYFAIARGRQVEGQDVVASEMTKWFDTNYHYIVPELYKTSKFKLSSDKIFDQYLEAKALGVETRPVLLGPITYLKLAKTKDEGIANLQFLPDLLPVYKEILQKLSSLGATQIQIDEPFLALDLTDAERKIYKETYSEISKFSNLKITIATYFDDLRENLETAVNLPVSALHVDLVRRPNQLETILAKLPADKTLSIGVVDGRNIWKNNFSKSTILIDKAIATLGKDRVVIA
ncbi:MAG: hypothetical protein SFT90_04720, partial [Rickettsiales bacterium]|nr:hypothetical protein [Rickettsiales bacterium]